LHKTVEEIRALPASEIAGWMEYFKIYPFTQVREDFRFARTLQFLNRVPQSMAIRGDKSWEWFMPDYLGTRDLSELSEQEQIEAELAFEKKYEEAEQRVKGL